MPANGTLSVARNLMSRRFLSLLGVRLLYRMAIRARGCGLRRTVRCSRRARVVFLRGHRFAARSHKETLWRGSSSQVPPTASAPPRDSDWQPRATRSCCTRGTERARGGRHASACRSRIGVLVADVSTMSECRRLAELANRIGRFDAVIHNVGVFHSARRDLTADGYRADVRRQHGRALHPDCSDGAACPPRLSELGHACIGIARSDDLAMGSPPLGRQPGVFGLEAARHHACLRRCKTLAAACFRTRSIPGGWPPGWAAPARPTISDAGSATQAWLASSAEPAARVSGKLFHHYKPRQASADARNAASQDALLERLAEITGIASPDLIAPGNRR